MKLYEYAPSGNCYKVRLLLAHLGVEYERIHMELRAGAARSPEFQAKTALMGRVPALELDDGSVLPESNAILCYLGEGTRYLPGDRLARAHALKWMFWEQYDHEPYIAVVRAWKAFWGVPAGREAELPMRVDRGYSALGVMEEHFSRHAWFTGADYGVADIALYAYTHVAGDGGFELDRFPEVRAWLARVAAQPGHVTIDQ
jgi:glutathione S-transferase